jgi:hypothetical protein
MRALAMAAGLVAAVLATPPAAAGIATYSISGIGAGTLGAEEWTGAFTIRMAADLSRRQGDPGVIILPLLPYALVELEYRATSAELGFDTLLAQEEASDTVALARAAPQGKENPILLDFRTGEPVNLLRSFGPIPGLEIWRFGEWRDVATSAGLLSIVAIEGLTFSASVRVAAPVPEPASWAMLIAGFGILGVAVRRRRFAQV